MEWLLLLFLGGITAGLTAYLLREDETSLNVSTLEKEKSSEQENDSSRQETAGSQPKVKFQIEQEDLQKFKNFVRAIPSPIEPTVRQTDDLKKTVAEIKTEIRRKKKPLKVTYTTEEIIPRTSPFARHRRPLLNAEKFVEEQKANEALSIYERVEKRITDEEIKRKIQTNIEDIKKWLLGIEEEEPVEFPEIIIPLSTQLVALEKFNEGLMKISEDMANALLNILKESFQELQPRLEVTDATINAREIKGQKVSYQESYTDRIQSRMIETDTLNIKNSDTAGASSFSGTGSGSGNEISGVQGTSGGHPVTEVLEGRGIEEYGKTVMEKDVTGAGGGISRGLSGGRILEGAGRVETSAEIAGGSGTGLVRESNFGQTTGNGRKEQGGIAFHGDGEDSGVAAKPDQAGGKEQIPVSGWNELKQMIIEELKKELPYLLQPSTEIERDAAAVLPTGNRLKEWNYFYYIPSFVHNVPEEIEKKYSVPQLHAEKAHLPVGPAVPASLEEYLNQQSKFTQEESLQDLEFDEKGRLVTDGWTDEDFEREWEKFKHLPLIDRRSGEDRRKNRTFDTGRPDRRSGVDRRKINLFEEREKFLEKYEKHLKRKQLLETLLQEKQTKDKFPSTPLLNQSEEADIKNVFIPVIPDNTEGQGLQFRAPSTQIISGSQNLEKMEFPEGIRDTLNEIQESLNTLKIEAETLKSDFDEEDLEELLKNINGLSQKEESFDTAKAGLQAKNVEIDLERLELPDAEIVKEEKKDAGYLPLQELEDVEPVVEEQVYQNNGAFSSAKVEFANPELEKLEIPEAMEENIHTAAPEVPGESRQLLVSETGKVSIQEKASNEIIQTESTKETPGTVSPTGDESIEPLGIPDIESIIEEDDEKESLVPLEIPDLEWESVGDTEIKTVSRIEKARVEMESPELLTMGLPDPLYDDIKYETPGVPASGSGSPYMPAPLLSGETGTETEEKEATLPPEELTPDKGTLSQNQQMTQQQLGEGVEELELPPMDMSEPKAPVQEIRGVLELKTPDEEDAPFLTLTYDFSKIPDSFQLSKNYHTLEYVYYKYKPLLIKAQEFARRKMVKNALNYYRMIKSQNIPPEFKRMINRNIRDITDYIEKYMMGRSGD